MSPVSPAAGAEVFLAARPEASCPCGGGSPPPAPCGTRPDLPVSCWADAYAMTARPGDTVTFLEGEHDVCPAIDRRGRRLAPFTYRGRAGGVAVVHCPAGADGFRVAGRHVVVEDLRIVASSEAPVALRIAGDAARADGRHVLRRLEIEGARTGLLVEGAGGNVLEDVRVRGSATGLDIGSVENRLLGVRVEETGLVGVVLHRGAHRNLLSRLETRHTGGSGVLILAGAEDNTVVDSRVAGTGPGHGIEVRGSGTVLRRCDVSGAHYHGVLIAGREAPVEGVRVASCDLHGNGTEEESGPVGDGLKIEVSEDAVVEDSRIAGNIGNGVLEGGSARRTRIERCVIASNGTDRYAHGVYTKGEGGVIRGCRVLGNAGYGLHLWAAPRDYLVEKNEVSGNGTAQGGGIVIGGTPSEAPPGRSGLPENVVVRRNRLTGNLGPALDYLLPPAGTPDGCLPGTTGNAFLDNDITPLAGTLPVRLRGARQGCVTLRGNRIRPAIDAAPPSPPPPAPNAPAAPGSPGAAVRTGPGRDSGPSQSAGVSR